MPYQIVNKVTWKAGTMIYPLPAVMVSCGCLGIEENIITISWTGTICTNPPMCYISIRPERYSYGLIKKYENFVINLTTSKLKKATDWCGVKSGKDYNKFKEMKLTAQKASQINSPLIAESPVNIECHVKEIKVLGSHDMFIAEVIAINVNDNLINKKSETLELYRSGLITYSHGFYYHLAERIGKFGWSVEKKKRKK